MTFVPVRRGWSWVLVAILAFAAAACAGSTKSPGASPTTLPGGSAPPSSSTPATTAPSPPTSGLRGVRVAGVQCPPVMTPGAQVEAVPEPSSYVLCPLEVPGGSGGRVTIGRGDAQFSPLTTALSTPDQPATGQVCAMYADVPQYVLANAAGVVYQVSIPVDGCRHYLRVALEALNRARGG